MPYLELDGRLYKALTKCCKTEKSRYSGLRGVAIRDGALEAADGMLLVRVEDAYLEGAKFFSALFSDQSPRVSEKLSAGSAALEAAAGVAPPGAIDPPEEALDLESDRGLTYHIPVLTRDEENGWPDTEKTIPKDEGGVVVRLRTDVLRRLCDIVDEVSAGSPVGEPAAIVFRVFGTTRLVRAEPLIQGDRPLTAALAPVLIGDEEIEHD